MKEKKPAMVITIECENKNEVKKALNLFKDAIAAGIPGLTEDDSDEPGLEAFCPKEGDICTYTECDDEPSAVFLFNGKEHVNEDGIRMLESELSMEYSGNLLQPYIVIRGEGQEVSADDCRLATKEEIKLFHEKVKDTADKQDKWNVGDWVYVVGCDSGCNKTFYSVPVTYAETKTMENLVKRGWIFEKESECNVLCDKLNEAIKNVRL